MDVLKTTGIALETAKAYNSPLSFALCNAKEHLVRAKYRKGT